MVPSVSVTPSNPLIDDELVIRVTGLRPRQVVTLHARTELESGVTASSHAAFVANQNGEVDVSIDPSINGTYTGVHQMGLFWSMSHDPGWEKTRFMKRDVMTPMVTNLRVFDGDIERLDIEQHEAGKSPDILASSEIHRWYKAPGVQRVRLKHDILCGTLFIPKGKGPFPAVIDMFGGIGGRIEIRAALFASRGILALALPYYEMAGVPKDIFHNTKLTYFKEAVKWLSSNPLANPGGIGVVGVSFGGVLANFLALKFEQVKAVVTINFVPYPPLIPPVEVDHGPVPMIQEQDNRRLIYSEEGVHTKFMFVHHKEELSRSWESKAKFLCILGADDQCVDPTYIQYWYAKWPPDQKHRVTVLKYPDAGHLIEPPYTPLNRTCPMVLPFHRNEKYLCVFGGRPKRHAHAQKDSWSKIMTFLYDNLSHDKTVICKL